MGIEPTSSAWKAVIIPLYDIRKVQLSAYVLTVGVWTARSKFWKTYSITVLPLTFSYSWIVRPRC